MTTLEKLERHLRQLAPHVAARENGRLAKEAADRIRELERENARLREALEIIASGDADARRRAEDALSA